MKILDELTHLSASQEEMWSSVDYDATGLLKTFLIIYIVSSGPS
jgi:hypothetical protein